MFNFKAKKPSSNYINYEEPCVTTQEFANAILSTLNNNQSSLTLHKGKIDLEELESATGTEFGPVVCIIAGEVSGDNLGAGLINQLKKHRPDLRFIGVGGNAMRAAGCHCWYDVSELAYFGVVDVVKNLHKILKTINDIKDKIKQEKPVIYIGIDSPDLNLRVANYCKNELKVKTVQYISPSVWAWRQGRISTIKQATDLVLCILPFEPAFYEKYNHPAVYIGHRMASELQNLLQKDLALFGRWDEQASKDYHLDAYQQLHQEHQEHQNQQTTLSNNIDELNNNTDSTNNLDSCTEQNPQVTTQEHTHQDDKQTNNHSLIGELKDSQVSYNPTAYESYDEQIELNQQALEALVDNNDNNQDELTCALKAYNRRQALAWIEDNKQVALLPGSRVSEIKLILPKMLASVDMAIKSQILAQDTRFVLPVAKDELLPLIKDCLTKFKDLQVQLVDGNAQQVLNSSLFAIVASGTATLDSLLCHCPLVVCYELSKWNYFIAKRLIKVPYVALSNIVFNQEISKELIQDKFTPNNVTNEIKKLVNPYENLRIRQKFIAKHQEILKDSDQLAALAIMGLIEQAEAAGKVKKENNNHNDNN